MSISRPMEVLASPIKRRFGTNNELGKLYETGKDIGGEGIGWKDVSLPFRFIVLDDSFDIIVGKTDEGNRLSSGYFRGRTMPIFLKEYSVGGRAVFKGCIDDDDFRDLVKLKQGRRAKNLFVMLEDGVLAQLQLKGQSYASYLNARGESSGDNPYWEIASFEEKENKRGKTSLVPVFTKLADNYFTASQFNEALRLDGEVLQPYLDAYVARLKGGDDAEDAEGAGTEEVFIQRNWPNSKMLLEKWPDIVVKYAPVTDYLLGEYQGVLDGLLASEGSTEELTLKKDGSYADDLPF